MPQQERDSVRIVRRAAERVLAVEADVSHMPPETRDWFMNKPGHRESFALARLALRILKMDDSSVVVGSAITETANEIPIR